VRRQGVEDPAGKRFVEESDDRGEKRAHRDRYLLPDKSEPGEE